MVCVLLFILIYAIIRLKMLCGRDLSRKEISFLEVEQIGGKDLWKHYCKAQRRDLDGSIKVCKRISRLWQH